VAKKGDVCARFNLGVIEEYHKHHNLAIKHFELAAAAGDEDAMKRLRTYFSLGKISEADLEETLRAHQAACDEMHSEERERYESFQKALDGSDDALKNLYADYYLGMMTAKELNAALKAHRR